MKKIILAFCFLGLFLAAIKPSYAVGSGYHYADSGYLYSNVSLPLDTGKAINLENSNQNIIPVSNLSGLKKGTASRTNILWLVELGDAGILKAAKNGKINKIDYVEIKREKLFIPLLFIPIYFDKYVTTVYGE